MRLVRVAVVLSVFVLTGAAQAKKDDVGEIKGDWTIVAMKMGERSAPDDLIKGLTSRFDGQGYTNRKAGEVIEEGSYQIDAGVTPRAIDFQIKKGEGAGKKQLAVFAIDGETLTLCVAEAGSEKRPTSLEPKANPGAIVLVLKRAKP